MLVEHGVESTYGIRSQVKHGAAAIENKDKFRKSFFHKKASILLLYTDKGSIEALEKHLVAFKATI